MGHETNGEIKFYPAESSVTMVSACGIQQGVAKTFNYAYKS
jgi:hypothetical protein